MKKTILFQAIIISFLLAVFSCGDSKEKSLSAESQKKGEVNWISFNDGLKLSSEKKKPVFIDFYADWCKYCLIMDSEVFSEKAIADTLNSKFVSIRIFTDRKDSITYKGKKFSAQEFAGYLGVEGLPTLVFMDSNGEFITKIPGYVNKDVFLPLIKYIDEGCYKNKISFADYKEGKTKCK